MNQCRAETEFVVGSIKVKTFCSLEAGHDGAHMGSLMDVKWPQKERSLNHELTEKTQELLKYLNDVNECEHDWTGKSGYESYLKTLNNERRDMPRRIRELYKYAIRRLKKDKLEPIEETGRYITIGRDGNNLSIYAKGYRFRWNVDGVNKGTQMSDETWELASGTKTLYLSEVEEFE
jgi:hypothetical protein